MEDDLHWKTSLGGRQPSVEDDHRWQKTFGGRHPLVVAPPLTAPAQLSQNWNFYKLSQPEKEFAMHAALCIHMCAEKKIFLGKDN